MASQIDGCSRDRIQEFLEQIEEEFQEIEKAVKNDFSLEERNGERFLLYKISRKTATYELYKLMYRKIDDDKISPKMAGFVFGKFVFHVIKQAVQNVYRDENWSEICVGLNNDNISIRKERRADLQIKGLSQGVKKCIEALAENDNIVLEGKKAVPFFEALEEYYPEK